MKWIPVGIELPNKQDDYLVTIPLDNNSTYVDVLHFHKGKFYETDSEWGDVVYDDVTAWMPLPKPYRKPENSSEKPNNCKPQTDNGIGCSRCEGRFDCYDRDMPHAVHCNNYGKITDEPQTDWNPTKNCNTCKYSEEDWTNPKCDSCCKANSHYEPKDEPTHGKMLVCPYCGLEVHSDFDYCPRCGADMTEREGE